MITIKRINHVAFVVEDIDSALHFWRDALGLDLSHVEDVPDQESVVAFLPVSESEVEIVKPINGDSGVARFLSRRGPGMHHICFEVDDVSAALTHLKRIGIRLINESPMIGTGGKQIAFIHPESTHGVLIELYQPNPDENRIRLERARHLAGRVLQESLAMTSATLAFLRNLRSSESKSLDKKPS